MEFQKKWNKFITVNGIEGIKEIHRILHGRTQKGFVNGVLTL